MIFNCHYVKGFIIGILYVYLIIGIYKNSLELSQIIRKKQRIKRLSLNMNKVISISFIHSLNIIYHINKLILPSVRISWYISDMKLLVVWICISAGFVFTLTRGGRSEKFLAILYCTTKFGKTYSSSSPVLS